MKSSLPIVSILLVLCSSAAGAQQRESPEARIVHITPQVVEEPASHPYFVRHQKTRRPRIALVLSGGGARGIASVGVLRSLEAHRIPIDLIVGTSMGSIIGGLYAAGYTPGNLKSVADTTAWGDVITYSDEAARRDLFLDQKNREERSFLAVRFKGLSPIIPSAFSTGQRLTNLLNLLCLQGIYHPGPSFDSLGIPFRATATDLVSGTQVVIGSGNLSQAMRASMTVPLLFTPVEQDSAQLVDGGLIANVPVDVARKAGADFVIAVDVTSPLRPRDLLNQFWEIGDQIMGIMMQASNREQLAKADIVIRPRLEGHLASDFSNLDSIIAEGTTATDTVADLIRRKYDDVRRARIPRGPVYRLTNIQIDSSLRSPFAPHPQGLAADPDTVSQRELQLYVDRLYETGKYQAVSADIEDSAEASILSISCTKYPRLKSVVVTGNRLISTEAVSAPFGPLLNHHINAWDIDAALKEVLREYRMLGYSLARFRNVSFDANSGVATLDIDEGSIYRMDIHGTEKTRDYVIWREIPLKRDDVFEISKMATGIRNLNSTSLFEQVAVGVHEENSHNVVDLNIKERSTELLRLGIRIDNERNIQPSIDIRDDDFLGIGSELGAGYFGGLRNRNYYGEFRATRIFNSYFTFNLKGYYKLLDYYTYGDAPTQSDVRWDRYRTGEYREEHRGVSAAFGTQLERLGTMTVEGRVEDQSVWNTAGNPLPGTEDFGISSIKVGTIIDTKDKYDFPTNGTYLNISYESALLKVIQAVGFTKFSFQYDYYQTAFGTQTIHPKIILGVADATTPITEQFWLGGQDSFFGLAEHDSLGRQIFVASLEYQLKLPFKLFFDTYFKLRYDFGSLWPSPAQISLSGLRHGIGATIGFDTPIGPAQFSVGKSFFPRLDILNKPFSYGPFVTYFSIGYEL